MHSVLGRHNLNNHKKKKKITSVIYMKILLFKSAKKKKNSFDIFMCDCNIALKWSR